MKIDLFTLADDAGPEEGGKLRLRGAGISHVRSDSLPVVVEEIAAVARFALEHSDLGTTHEFTIRFLGPDGSVIAQSPTLRAEIGVGEWPPHEGEEAALNLVIRVGGLIFERPGGHVVQLEVDSEVVAERRIAVIVASSEG